MEAKDEFIKIFKANIKREGADKLLDYLQNQSDFFTAPASGKRHSNFEGGLTVHSLNVYKRLKKNVELEYGADYLSKISNESIAIIGLLHDICKVNTYTVDYRNVKENNNWVQKPYYSYYNTLPYGHGEKSVYIISGFMRLTREEAIAINWHMGGFDLRVQGSSDLSDAYARYPIAVLTHISDLEASYIDETIEK